MPTIKTHVDQLTYDRLVKKRREHGLPSVSALFLDRCDELTDKAEAREIVLQALRRATRKPAGSEYRLCDLFRKERWHQFSKGARLRAGKLFHEKVAAAVDGVRAARKSSTGHQIYETSGSK